MLYTLNDIAGGNIASSWAVLQCMGQDGYTEVAKRLMDIATHMKEGIQSIEVRIDQPFILYRCVI